MEFERHTVLFGNSILSDRREKKQVQQEKGQPERARSTSSETKGDSGEEEGTESRGKAGKTVLSKVK